jgi:hypothetical protein
MSAYLSVISIVIDNSSALSLISTTLPSLSIIQTATTGAISPGIAPEANSAEE